MNTAGWQGGAESVGSATGMRRMADDVQQSAVAARTWIGRVRGRLLGRTLLLLAIGLMLLSLSGLQLLAPWVGVLAFVSVVLLVAIVPDTAESATDAGEGTADASPAFAEAIRLFADALPDPTIIVDRRSVIVHLNAEARRHFPAVIDGNPIAFTMRFPPLLTAIERARSSGSQTIEMHQAVPTETWYRATVAPLWPGQSANDGVLVISLQSLTEGKRLESLRTDFIANASHELRTPLTSLVGFIDTLLGPAANDRAARERFLGLMQAQAGRMSKLIDDLLSLSRIEMRQHVRPTAPVDLVSLAREVAEALGKLAVDAGAPLRLDLPDAPVIVAGDRDELYEVFENLVENAIKYGAEGGAIDIAVATSNRPGFDIVATVTDYGAGVAAEHVPRLTERFYRVDAESSRKKKGTGLGLAIVKHIVTRHQGQLTIRSQPGQGTRVEVLLRR